MRKTFLLNIEGKHRDRLLDAARHDIHRYLKRERKRPVPAGADFWDFDCRFGSTQDDAQTARLDEVKGLIDAVAQGGGTQFYIELFAKPGLRGARPAAAAAQSDAGEDEAGA